MVYEESSRTARATKRNLVYKQTKKLHAVPILRKKIITI